MNDKADKQTEEQSEENPRTLARREFMKIAAYTAPVLAPLLLNTEEALAATTCQPQSCSPANPCDPATCDPAAQCDPLHCLPTQCAPFGCNPAS